jgi:serine/threonine protein kinase/tetratricopeptide (TPR) repeat protein
MNSRAATSRGDTPMDPQHWQKLDDLFGAAVALEPPRRAAFIEAACAGDDALRGELLSLLAQHTRAEDFFRNPTAAVGELAAGLFAPSPGGPSTNPDPLIGRRLASYTIVERLGAGGMGVVYRAQQDSPSRTVALKVIRPGAISPSTLRRFRHESQILGRLQHPGIAQIYEAGEAPTPLGLQPYFAMQLVHGRPLLDFAAGDTSRAKLSLRGRLDLFARICDAVAHAHSKGVIHRDLKPANILVEEVAEWQSGQVSRSGNASTVPLSHSATLPLPSPKILDFGIARVTDSDLAISTIHTDLGQLIGTLAYMSPEQAGGGGGSGGGDAAIDTRADVYALGVILYELVSGRRPYDVGGRTVADAIRAVQETEPTRLGSIDRALRGDIETIVAKALEKSPSRRYQSVAALADDVRRHLRSEPIAARPATTVYQVSRFVRRHRALVTGVAIAFLALVLGIIGTSTGLVHARAETKRATAAANKAEQTSQYLLRVLKWFAPAQARTGETAILGRVLDQASGKVEAELRGQPEVAAAVRETIARGLQGLGANEQAETQARAALALREATAGPASPEAATARLLLGAILQSKGDLPAAEAAERLAFDQFVASKGTDSIQTMEARGSLGDLLRATGRFDESREMLEPAAAFFSALPDQTPEIRRTLAGTLNNLGLALRGLGNLDEGAQILRRSVSLFRELGDPDDAELAIAINSLAIAIKEQGDLEAAEPLYRETLAIRRRIYGGDHLAVAVTLNNLAQLLLSREKFPECESLLTESLDMRIRLLGPEHHQVPVVMENLALSYRTRGDYAGAVALLRRALDIRIKSVGPGAVGTVECRMKLSQALCSSGLYREAEPLAREVIPILRTKRTGDSYALSIAYENLGNIQLGLGDETGAEASYRDATDAADRTTSLPPLERAKIRINLGGIFLSQRRFSEAGALYSRAAQLAGPSLAGSASSRARALTGLGQCLLAQNHLDEAEDALCTAADLARRPSYEAAWADSVLGEIRSRQRRFTDAEPLLLESCAAFATEPTANQTDRYFARRRLADLYAAWGKPDRAAEFQDRAP